MKLQLTKTGQIKLDIINQQINDTGDKGYDNICEELNEDELLVCDAGMYVNDAYIKNEFDDLKSWCRELGPTEYQQTYLNTHPDVVYNKVQRMLSKGLIEIIK
jgi:hypothetical protein